MNEEYTIVTLQQEEKRKIMEGNTVAQCKCLEAKDKKYQLWEMFKRHGGLRDCNRLKKERNAYSKIRRQATT